MSSAIGLSVILFAFQLNNYDFWEGQFSLTSDIFYATIGYVNTYKGR